MPEATQDRPFNGFRTARTTNAHAVVLDVRKQVQAFEMHRIRSRARRPKDQASFERQIEALVCDLAHREITKPGAWLAVPFSKQVLGRKNRYHAPVLRETLPDVIQHMASPEMEFIEIIKGAHNPFDPEHSRQTVIRAGSRLRDRILDHHLGIEDFDLDQTQEIIVLKDAKGGHWDDGEWLQYEDTEQTRAYRTQLRQINDWLEQAVIEHVSSDKTPSRVDTTDLRLRRYFNDNSFELGGRLFGGFWMSMSREMRKGIVIDGMDTVTVDYGQMILRLLYALAGVNPEFKDGYRIPGLEGYRDGVKKVLSSLLYKTKPQKRMPAGLRELFPARISYANVVEKIMEHHPAVSEFLYTKTGPKLTYMESEILLLVLTKLNEKGITALPIHDAVIVPDVHQEDTMQVMLDVFKQVTSIDGVVSLDE